ncbi:hypothetical protein [Natronohydrobacter thiooxidans]|jgi:phosphoglucosamine mutase|nr:hypothetical protein [Natronohydrobacter thiooxidans]
MSGRAFAPRFPWRPVVRVMAECEDEGLLAEIVNGIIAEMEAVA